MTAKDPCDRYRCGKPSRQTGDDGRRYCSTECEIAQGTLEATAPEMAEALRALLSEAVSMNEELRLAGKGRPDGGAHPNSPMEMARDALTKAGVVP